MSVPAGVTPRGGGEAMRTRVHALSIEAGRVGHAVVEVGAGEPVIDTFRPRLIPHSARDVLAFRRAQVLDVLTEIGTATIDAIAIVTAQAAALWQAHLYGHVPTIPITVTTPVRAGTWAEYRQARHDRRCGSPYPSNLPILAGDHSIIPQPAVT